MYGDGYTSRTIGRFCVTVIWLVQAAASVSICLTPGCGARRDCEQIYVWASKDLEAGSAETEDPQLIQLSQRGGRRLAPSVGLMLLGGDQRALDRLSVLVRKTPDPQKELQSVLRQGLGWEISIKTKAAIGIMLVEKYADKSALGWVVTGFVTGDLDAHDLALLLWLKDLGVTNADLLIGGSRQKAVPKGFETAFTREIEHLSDLVREKERGQLRRVIGALETEKGECGTLENVRKDRIDSALRILGKPEE